MLKIHIYRKVEGEPDSTYVSVTAINDHTENDPGRLPNTTYRYKMVFVHPVYGENVPVGIKWFQTLYAVVTTPGLEGLYNSIYSPLYI